MGNFVNNGSLYRVNYVPIPHKMLSAFRIYRQNVQPSSFARFFDYLVTVITYIKFFFIYTNKIYTLFTFMYSPNIR